MFLATVQQFGQEAVGGAGRDRLEHEVERRRVESQVSRHFHFLLVQVFRHALTEQLHREANIKTMATGRRTPTRRLFIVSVSIH